MHSGKLLYEEQDDFLRSLGLTPCRLQPALWYKNLPKDGLLIVLQYSDDMLSASTDSTEHLQFKTALSKCFEIESNDRANWYLQAHINQDADGNITLDQSRYARSIVERYLPNAPTDASESDLEQYHNPLPTGFKFTKEDCSATDAEVKILESDFGFCVISVAGSSTILPTPLMRSFFQLESSVGSSNALVFHISELQCTCFTISGAIHQRHFVFIKMFTSLLWL
jgi:hypothetical protein